MNKYKEYLLQVECQSYVQCFMLRDTVVYTVLKPQHKVSGFMPKL